MIHPGATLHPSVTVGPYAVIGEQVTLGANTVVSAHVVIDGNTNIGERNKIFPGAAIGLEPQDLKYDGSTSPVKIGDDNLIREYVTINRPTLVGEITVIGHGNLLMAYSHVAHNCILHDHVIIGNSVALAGHVHIESYARVSGLSGVHQFVHIGQHAMVAGMTRIERDVPPYMIVEGNPSRVRRLNQIGLQRAGVLDKTEGQLYKELKQAYRILYRSGLTLAEALLKLEAEFSENSHIQHLRRFLQASTQENRRGAISGAKSGE